MTPKIVSNKIRHVVKFQLSPKEGNHRPEECFVGTRLVRDIVDYPDDAVYLTFHDVVETVVTMPDGTTTTVFSNAFNQTEWYVVSRTTEDHERVLTSWPEGELDVHPDVKGSIFVTATSDKQLAEQLAA